MLAGVRLVRGSEPSVEPTAFLVTGLAPDVRLSDILLVRHGDASHLELLQPKAFFSIIRNKLPALSPGMLDDVPALLFRWRFSPEDNQINVGGAVGISSSYRPFYSHGGHPGVGTVVWRKFLRQRIAPCTGFIHHRPPF